MDSFVLETPIGVDLRGEGEMNTESGEQKKHSLLKRGSPQLCFKERKEREMPSP